MCGTPQLIAFHRHPRPATQGVSQLRSVEEADGRQATTSPVAKMIKRWQDGQQGTQDGAQREFHLEIEVFSLVDAATPRNLHACAGVSLGAYQIFDSFHSTTLVHPFLFQPKLLLQCRLGVLSARMFLVRLIGVLVLVALNGFFARVEFSLVAVRLSRVRQLVAKGSSQQRSLNNSSLISTASFPASRWASR